MKKISTFLFAMVCFVQPVFASGEFLTSNIKHALKHSVDVSYMSVFVALGVVILLIYITGIIYAKLNVVGYKTLKKQYIDIGDTKLIIRSNTPIGNNKSLLVVELAGKRMLIGVTNDNITLIKDLDEKTPKSKENDLISNKNFEKSIPLDKIYPKNREYSDEDINIDKNIPDENEDNSPYDAEEFGLYKKYLD